MLVWVRLVLEAANREAVRLIAAAHARTAATHAQAAREGTIVLRTGPEAGVGPEIVVAAGVVVAGGKHRKGSVVSYGLWPWFG